MIRDPHNVLFLCTANSARSILGEALIQRLGQGRFRAFSAGSQPRGIPNPTGLKLLESLGHDISGFRSKSWDEFAADDAPRATQHPPRALAHDPASRRPIMNAAQVVPDLASPRSTSRTCVGVAHTRSAEQSTSRIQRARDIISRRHESHSA